MSEKPIEKKEPKTFHPIEAGMSAFEIPGAGCIIKVQGVFVPGACIIEDEGVFKIVSEATGRQDQIRRAVAGGGTVTLISEK
jgi:hypothetical protein